MAEVAAGEEGACVGVDVVVVGGDLGGCLSTN